MADKYCSAQFKTGEELDAALKAALDTCDYSVAASECRQAAEKHKTEAGVSEHNAEVYAEGGKLEAHEGQTVSPEEIPGAKGYMTEARSHKFVAGIQAENAKAYAEGGIPQQDVGDGMFVGGMPTLGAKGYADHAKVYVEGGEAPMTPPELGDGVVRSHGAKNLADRAAAYSVGGDYREYYRGGTWETIHVEKGAMQYAEEARLAAEQTKKDVQDAVNSADEAENFAIEARKMYMNAADAYSGAAAASGWAKSYKDEAAESAAAAAKSAEEAKNAAASGGGGSGGGGVSSWNDLTDKPFYSENMALVDTTLEIDPDMGAGILFDPIGLIAGMKCTVTWNGTEYVCTAQSFDGMGVPGVVVGNLGAMMGEAGTGEPFLIMEVPPEIAAEEGFYAVAYAIDGSTSVTLVIAGEVTKTIDPKFLPESLQFGSEQRKKVRLDESELALNAAGNYSLVNLEYTNLGFVVGETCDVTWNGVKYTCVAQSYEDSSYTLTTLGEPSGIGAEGDLTGNGEPFCIAVFYWKNGGGYQTTIYSHEKLESVSVKVEQDYEHVEKVDPKYLPDGLPMVENIGEPVLPPTWIGTGDGIVYTDASFGEVKLGYTYKITADDDVFEAVAEQDVLMGVPVTLLAVSDGVVSGYIGILPVPTDILGDGSVMATAIAMIPGYGGGDFTLSISAGHKAHKMDERCLPDGIAKTVVVTLEDGEKPSISFAEAFGLLRSGAVLKLRHNVNAYDIKDYEYSCVNNGRLMFYGIVFLSDGPHLETLAWSEDDTITSTTGTTRF